MKLSNHMFNREIVNYDNKVYMVYRKLPVKRFNTAHTDELMEVWYCDITLRNTEENNDYMYFLREIKDAEIVE